MSMERVLGEIEFAARHRVKLIGFCDANFGILPRDVDIARYIVQMKEQYGYPQEIGYTNAKTASPRLTEIIKLLSDGGLISQRANLDADDGRNDPRQRRSARTSRWPSTRR